jgi:hypothetical protein
MPPKRARRDGLGQQHSAADAGKEALRTSLNDAVNASVEKAFEAIELEDQKHKEERERLLAQAQTAAAKVKRDAATEVEEMKRKLQEDRAALEQEKAAMERTHTFQKKKILLNVGGHRFETSLQTLTSVPDTYFESLFSGRFELALDVEGTYSIDRDGVHFRHILNFLRDSGSFELSSDMTEGQRKELAVEIKFYGLLDRMMPHHAQERAGQALLRRACLAGTEHELRAAVAQTRALVFEIGSSTPFLAGRFQDLRFIITDRVVNDLPVWEDMSGELSMFRELEGDSWICRDSGMAMVNHHGGYMCSHADGYGTYTGPPDVAPTEVASDLWWSVAAATLVPQFESAEDATVRDVLSDDRWVRVPDMRITTVYGLDNGDPTMAAALRQLAALA